MRSKTLLVWVFVLGPFLVHQVLVRAVAQSEAASASPRITFVDETARSGVRFQSDVSKTSEKYLIESMVGGVAMLDFNADGWLDLFFVNGAALADPMPEGARPDKSAPRYWNRLYRNNGDGTFAECNRKSGCCRTFLWDGRGSRRL